MLATPVRLGEFACVCSGLQRHVYGSYPRRIVIICPRRFFSAPDENQLEGLITSEAIANGRVRQVFSIVTYPACLWSLHCFPLLSKSFCREMDANSEQPAAIAATESTSANEQEHNDEAMEETEEYSYEGDDYRHFMPRGRGGFRCVSRRVAYSGSASGDLFTVLSASFLLYLLSA